MPETKNCHFVPRVYLANFQITSKPKFVYSAKRTELGWSKFEQPMSIKKVCSMTDLYTIFKINKKADRGRLESKFNHEVESNLPKVYKKITEMPFLALNSADFKRSKIFNNLEEKTLIKFLAYQLVRSPAWFHKLKENFDNLSCLNKKERSKFKRLKKCLGKNKTENILSHEAFLKFIENSMKGSMHEKIIESSDWILCINCTKIPFITSDMPVIGFHEEYGSLFCPMTKLHAIQILPGKKNKQLKDIYIRTTYDETFIENWNYILTKRAYSDNYHFSRIISDNKDLLKYYIEKIKTDPHVINK